MLHPCNRIVRQLSRLAGSGQFSKRCFQAELQKLLNTRDNRAATDMMMPGNGLITLAGARIQEKRRPKRTPFFFGSRFANGLEIEQILLAELEGTALPREGHDPLKHKSSQMYRYLENANLVGRRYRGSETRPDGVGIRHRYSSRSQTQSPCRAELRAPPGTDAS